MNETVMFEDAYFDEKGAWFSASTHNGLYYWDFERGTVRFMGIFPNEPLNGMRLYSKVIFFENKLVFVPNFAKRIGEYDMVNHTFRNIEIPESEKRFSNMFVGAIQIDCLIYLFSLHSGNIYQYDMKIGKIKIMKEWCELVKPYIFDIEESEFSFINAKIDKNKIFLPCYSRNVFFIFDLVTNKNEVKLIHNERNEGICNIEIYNDEIYLFATESNKIYRCNYDLSKYEVIYYEREISSNFICSIVKADKLYFWDIVSARLFQINLDSNEVVMRKQFEILNKKEYLNFIYPYADLKCIFDEKIVACPMGRNYLLEVTEEEINEVIVPDVENEEGIFKMGSDVEIWNELEYCSLKGYQLWMSDKEMYDMKIKTDGFGKKIYQILK